MTLLMLSIAVTIAALITVIFRALQRMERANLGERGVRVAGFGVLLARPFGVREDSKAGMLAD
ncbi:MAG: hypothetical protein Q8Q62_11290 [Mesorhizobium sp.]|nr:hypothetical protein [Mesorhizobium sp.]